jgi:D-glycero-D-manno-heptose 1,7-bisphosphate phosphatase
MLLGRRPSAELRPALFLDRDGVINRRVVNGYVTDPASLEVLDVALDASRRAYELGALVVVVSNQGCIARGLATPGQVISVHAALLDELNARRVALDAFYWCPHHPSATDGTSHCGCRKPEPGMLTLAASELGIDVRRSVMVGDQPSDAAAAAAAGIPAAMRITVTEGVSQETVTGSMIAAFSRAGV